MKGIKGMEGIKGIKGIRRYCALLLSPFLVIASICNVHAGVPRLPLEDFAKLPRFSDPEISPNGKRLLSTMPMDGKPLLVVQKLLTKNDPEEEPLVPIRSGRMHMNWYQWASDERLLVSLRATRPHDGHLLNLTRVVSVDRHGENMVGFKQKADVHGNFRQYVEVVSMLEDDDDHVLMALDDEPQAWASPRVHKVNVHTGDKRRVLKNTRGVLYWVADKSGQIRIGVIIQHRLDKSKTKVLYRKDENSKWETLQELDYFDHERLVPYRFDEDDPNSLLITSDSLRTDEDLGKIEDNLFRYDLTQRKIIGKYINARRDKVLMTVRGAAPDREVDIVSHDKSKNTYLLRVYSDVKAPDYFILNIKDKNLVAFASEYPDLNDKPLASMRRVEYTARDGLKIPAFLTLPVDVGDKNLPVVVLPHGGPWAHDRWGFDNYVQFLANRGYAVFQPQFRGSTGLGIEHEEAGYGQWGYVIQDDITDGVRWLIDQKIADPKRICIVGSNFGGYAAAMGAVKTPDLYRCAISINGVLDLKYFIDSSRRLLFKTIKKAMWNSRKEAHAASPYHMAKNISAPMLLIGSERDTVVPVSHSKSMYKRLKRMKKDVEYVELPNGEHWRTNEGNEIRKFKAIEKFLDKHLGGETVQEAL